MDIVEYREKVKAGKIVNIATVVFSILVICIFALIIKYSFYIESSLLVITVIPLLIGALILASFRNFKITISSKELVVKYGFFCERFLLREIESCEQVKTGEIRKYVGLGVRVSINTTYFLASFGDAVRINKTGERTFVFSSNHPDEICRIISTKKQYIMS
jgi:tetrahydromethanopterin S-methyltransferase subunit E